MYQLSFNIRKNDDPNDRAGEGFYSAADRADVIAVFSAAVGTVDLAEYTPHITQFSAPDAAGQAALMREVAEVIAPSE